MKSLKAKSLVVLYAAISIAALFFFYSPIATAQEQRTFPWKPVRLIVTSAVGNVTDMSARLLASKLSVMWGQPVIVEQKVGGNGSIGTDFVVRSPADGHTILMTTTALVQTLALRKQLRYDIFKDLSPISQVFILRLVFATGNKVPVKTLDEFIRLAKANPGKYTFASFGVGSTGHMVIGKLNHDAGIDVVHVPYSGTTPAVRALVAGEVDATLADLFLVKQYIAGGKAKILASTGGKRSPYSPEVPTFAQSGVSGFGTDNWAAWFAPAGTPEPVLVKIAEDIRKAQAMPDVQAWYANAGIEIASTTPAELRQIVRQDADYWINLVKETGIKAE
jgi:tripartite-type tricarboxylate transporter receptor subunit TctC